MLLDKIYGILVQELMGPYAWDIIRRILEENMMDNVSFMRKLLRNVVILNTGRKLQTEYEEGNRIVAEETERLLVSQVVGMIEMEKEEEEKEELREVLESVLKEIVEYEYEDADMTRLLLNKEDIRAGLKVFEAAEDDKEKQQAREDLCGIIRDTEGAETLAQR